MDFLDPELGSNSSVYHDLIEKNKENFGPELPTDIDIKNAPSVISVWQGKDQNSYEVIDFTQAVRNPRPVF